MKIVYVVRHIDSTGGRERVLTQKANYFTRKFGYKVFIITMFQREERTIFELDNRIQTHHLKLIHHESFKGGRFKYGKYVKEALEKKLIEISPDITLSMWWGIEFKVLPFIKDGSRKILEFHSSQYMRYYLHRQNKIYIYQKIRLLITRWLENKIANRYEKLIILTNEEKHYWGCKNIVVIPNALSFISEKQSDCSNHVIISTGRLTKEKGFYRLIKIWAAIATEYPDWSLKIFGDGEDKEELSGLIKKLDLKNAFLLPATLDIKEEMLKASIFVFTSRYEGFGMVLTEAMQCGLPVVSYDTKCGPRDIIDDKISGFLIKEGDESSFAEKLSCLIKDKALRLDMGMAAKQISSQKFAEDLVMNKWKKLFEGKD